MNYSEKLVIANKYLYDAVGLGWNDLADINSLHDCEDEDDIHSACHNRMKEEGYV